MPGLRLSCCLNLDLWDCKMDLLDLLQGFIQLRDSYNLELRANPINHNEIRFIQIQTI